MPWNNSANTNDTAMIRSSRAVVFRKKGFFTNFENSQENTFSRVNLKEATDLYSLTLSKKEILQHVYL